MREKSSKTSCRSLFAATVFPAVCPTQTPVGPVVATLNIVPTSDLQPPISPLATHNAETLRNEGGFLYEHSPPLVLVFYGHHAAMPKTIRKYGGCRYVGS